MQVAKVKKSRNFDFTRHVMRIPPMNSPHDADHLEWSYGILNSPLGHFPKNTVFGRAWPLERRAVFSMFGLRNGKLAVPDPDNVFFPLISSATRKSLLEAGAEGSTVWAGGEPGNIIPKE